MMLSNHEPNMFDRKVSTISVIKQMPEFKQHHSEFDDEEIYHDDYNFFGGVVNDEKYYIRQPYWIKISYYFSEKVDPNSHKLNEVLKGQASKIVKWQEKRINVQKQTDDVKKFTEIKSDDSNPDLKASSKKKKENAKIK